MNLTPIEIGLLMLVLMFIFIYLKMPLGLAMLVPAFLGFWLLRGMPVALSSLRIVAWTTALNDILLLIPLFSLMGLLASYGGISKGAFDTIYKWVGHLPGGLAMACTGACAAFGAVCGNTLATSLTMTSVALPEMRKRNYRDDFSIGCIASSGNLGIMIPPSGSFVIYGFLTQTSIGQLFMAGILPGVMLTLMFWVQTYVHCRINPKIGPPGPRFGWIERLKSIKGIWSVVLVFVVVMGGIYGGIFTPNEAASCGVFVVFVIALATKGLTWKLFVSALRETIMISAMTMLVILGAMYFSSFMAASEIPFALADWIVNTSTNPYIIMFMILIVYFISGSIMDIYPALVITLPILFPVVQALGFDPLQFGVLCTLMIMIGGITPPFGMQVFAIGGLYKELTTWQIFRGCWPYVCTMAVGAIILVFVPQISTLLPDLMVPYR